MLREKKAKEKEEKKRKAGRWKIDNLGQQEIRKFMGKGAQDCNLLKGGRKNFLLYE